jgi:hypothetical protein
MQHLRQEKRQQHTDNERCGSTDKGEPEQIPRTGCDVCERQPARNHKHGPHQSVMPVHRHHVALILIASRAELHRGGAVLIRSRSRSRSWLPSGHGGARQGRRRCCSDGDGDLPARLPGCELAHGLPDMVQGVGRADVRGYRAGLEFRNAIRPPHHQEQVQAAILGDPGLEHPARAGRRDVPTGLARGSGLGKSHRSSAGARAAGPVRQEADPGLSRGRGLLKAFAGRQDDPGGPVIAARPLRIMTVSVTGLLRSRGGRRHGAPRELRG